jgi:NAD(P)-dependent dehydrogenase (short-subunit alcohol dehydrogenase family)
VSKHAAVAFAEWLSVTYGARGIGVSCLCPMGVNTDLLHGSGGAGDVVKAAGTVLEPAEVAEVVLAGLETETFLILPHPEVLEFFRRKGADYDRWLAGMRRLQASVAASPGSV